MDTDRDLTGRCVELGDAEQLDDVAEALRHRDVVRGDAADVVAARVVGIDRRGAHDDLGAERDGGHDRRLGAGVVTLDVCRGIAFGEPESLGVGERSAVVGAVLGHLREDVVGGAVDDPHDPGHGLAAQALAQGPHHRDATGHRCLEQQVDTAFVRRGEQFGADVREQLLVRSDHRFAVSQRRGDQLPRRLDAADHLDHEVDRRVGHHCGGVASQHTSGQVHVAFTAEVAHGNGPDLQTYPGTCRDLRLLSGDEGHERRPDVAAAEHADTDGAFGGFRHGREATGWTASRSPISGGPEISREICCLAKPTISLSVIDAP